MRQIPLALLAPPAPSFDNLLPGANAEALAYLMGLMPGDPPVLLWGPTGSGKTMAGFLPSLVELIENPAAAH